MSNSKNCPNPSCAAPIQKHEGCNHVKCSKCKYEFCWLCLEPWKKHSSSTGGYFQCNRYEATSKAFVSRKLSILEAEEAHQRAAESNKFAHYYARFKNHEHSLELEQGLLRRDHADEPCSEASITELLRARRVLRCSYVYGFFLGQLGFGFIQIGGTHGGIGQD